MRLRTSVVLLAAALVFVAAIHARLAELGFAVERFTDEGFVASAAARV